MYKTRLLLSLGLTMSLGAFGFQQPSSSSQSQQPSTDSQTQGKKSKPTSSTSDTGTRSRAGEYTGMLTPADEKFVMDAARGGMMEVELGKAAQEKASSQAVKDFGKKMEQDHSQANKELADIAKSKNVSLPTDVGSEKKEMDKIMSQSGAAFDKTYMKQMVRDHRKDVKEFERESNNGMDSDVKAFAAKTLPTLREHLRMAEETEKNLKGGSSSSSSASSTDSSKTGTGTSDTTDTSSKSGKKK